MKRRKKQGCGQRTQEAGKGSGYHHLIDWLIGYLIMETIFSMDQTCCDYNFSEFSGVLLGLQLIPTSLRRHIWERINNLISFLGWEYLVIEVTVLKESIFTILSNKFQIQWSPECKMFLLSVGFPEALTKDRWKGKVQCIPWEGLVKIFWIQLMFFFYFFTFPGHWWKTD